MKDIIAVTGYHDSGKDTAADIVEQLFPNAVRVTFAKHLKSILSNVFELDPAHFYLREAKDKDLEDPIYLTPDLIDKTLRLYGIEAEYQDFKKFIGKMIYKPRELMEFMGTEVLQSFDKQIHIKREFMVAPKSELYLVSDLRFVHELEYLRANAKGTIQILYIQNDIATVEAMKRKSIAEKEIPTIAKSSLYVDNNGSLEALRLNIEKYIKV